MKLNDSYDDAVADGERVGVGAHAHVHLGGPLVRHLPPAQVPVDHRPSQDRHRRHLDHFPPHRQDSELCFVINRQSRLDFLYRHPGARRVGHDPARGPILREIDLLHAMPAELGRRDGALQSAGEVRAALRSAPALHLGDVLSNRARPLALGPARRPPEQRPDSRDGRQQRRRARLSRQHYR